MSFKPIRCLIVDDEPAAHLILENYINRLDELSLVGHCYNAIEALQFLREKEVDLLFLDINMPELTGIEMLEVQSKPPLTILTTAYSDYAVKGFELGVVDYLMKPIGFPRFMKAIDRVLDLSQSKPNNGSIEKAKKQEARQIFLKIDGRSKKFELDTISYIQAYGNYVKINLRDGSVHLYAETMTNMLNMLPKSRFLKTHKSYIVGIKQVNFIQGSRIQLITGQDIPIGNTHKSEVLKVLTEINN